MNINDKMHTTLGKTQLLPYFEGKLHSTSDAERGKPFPDVYLYAARSMGVNDPSKCLVIEDSPPGVEGGVSAGMSVFGYTELMNEERLLVSIASSKKENFLEDIEWGE